MEKKAYQSEGHLRQFLCELTYVDLRLENLLARHRKDNVGQKHSGENT